jgi:hypothetical protein
LHIKGEKPSFTIKGIRRKEHAAPTGEAEAAIVVAKTRSDEGNQVAEE